MQVPWILLTLLFFITQFSLSFLHTKPNSWQAFVFSRGPTNSHNAMELLLILLQISFVSSFAIILRDGDSRIPEMVP